MNKKGGMDNHEFELYLFKKIFPPFADAKDHKGKRGFLKVYSGPGRLNVQLLCKCHLLGFILCPCVLNKTAVSRDTDINYGTLNTAFHQILDVVVQNSITVNKSTSLPPWIIGLVVFGGNYPESKKAVARNAFEDVLNKESCIDAWAKVGEAPCTIECLKDDQVRRTLCDDLHQYETNIPMEKLNDANDLSKFNFTVAGYQGRLLKFQC